MSAGMEVAKAGWLYRQSSVLHRWKKNWFVLYRDGLLRYFESPESPRAEEVYVLRSCCQQVKTGMEVLVEPPTEVSSAKGALMELVMRDGSNVVVCAESIDDMKAWQYALEDARTMVDPNSASGYTRTVPITYSGYGGYPYSSYIWGNEYPGQVISAPPGQQVIHNPDGTTTIINPNGQVVYVDSAYPYRRRYRYYDDYGYGLGAGFLGVIQTPNGTTTIVNPGTQVVYVPDSYPYRRRYRGFGFGYSPLFWPYYY